MESTTSRSARCCSTRRARSHAIPSAGADVDSWQPVPEPSSLELLAGALLESAQDPGMALQNLRGALASALGVAVAVGEVVGGIGGALGELAADALRGQRPSADSPLAGVVSEQRRFATVSGVTERSQGSPPGARPHDQRCGAGHDLGWAAYLAADARRVDQIRKLTDRARPDECH